MKTLTPNEKKVWGYISNFSNWRPPSQRATAKALGFNPDSGTMNHLFRSLKRKGYKI